MGPCRSTPSLRETAMIELQPPVTRTWKRDGTTNLMGLDEAVTNLAQNQLDAETNPDDYRLAIRRPLLAGQTLWTAKATFALQGDANVVERRRAAFGRSGIR